MEPEDEIEDFPQKSDSDGRDDDDDYRDGDEAESIEINELGRWLREIGISHVRDMMTAYMNKGVNTKEDLLNLTEEEFEEAMRSSRRDETVTSDWGSKYRRSMEERDEKKLRKQLARLQGVEAFARYKAKMKMREIAPKLTSQPPEQYWRQQVSATIEAEMKMSLGLDKVEKQHQELSQQYNELKQRLFQVQFGNGDLSSERRTELQSEMQTESQELKAEMQEFSEESASHSGELSQRVQATLEERWIALSEQDRTPFTEKAEADRSAYDAKFEKILATVMAKYQRRAALEHAWAATWLQADEELLQRQEICLLKGALTTKHEWQAKIFDEAIVAKWREEALQQDAEHFDQAVLELRSNCYFNRHGLAYVDDLVSAQLRSTLEEVLDGIAAQQRDFQPDTNNKIQNLIHPSLFALSVERWMSLDAFLDRHGYERYLPVLRSAGYDLPKLAGLSKGDCPRLPESQEPAQPHDAAISGTVEELVKVQALGLLKDAVGGYPAVGQAQQTESSAELSGVVEEQQKGNRALNRGIRTTACLELHTETIDDLRQLGIANEDACDLLLHARSTCFRAGVHPNPLFEENRLGKMLNNIKWRGSKKKKPIDSSDSDETGERRWKARVPLDPLWHCTTGADDAAKYRWLPAEVLVDEHGGVRFVSYINNLLPCDSPTLTPLLEQLLQHALPGLESVLCNPDGSKPYCLRGRRLQVIVKAANYVLQPGQTYEGGWHVEGVPAERIVASAIFYYSTSDNMRGGNLQFRRMRNLNLRDGMVETIGNENDDNDDNDDYSTSVSLGDDGGWRDDLPSGQPRHRFSMKYGEGRDNSQYVWRFRGERRASALNHAPVDEIATTEGRWLFFKNSLQHRVGRLYNTSESKPATRKILIFWLVHPDLPITSTADVPPQQWDEILRPAMLDVLATKKVRGAAAELIVDRARTGFTRDEAKQHRIELMHERKFVKEKVNSGFERHIEREYSFCEH